MILISCPANSNDYCHPNSNHYDAHQCNSFVPDDDVNIAPSNAHNHYPGSKRCCWNGNCFSTSILLSRILLKPQNFANLSIGSYFEVTFELPILRLAPVSEGLQQVLRTIIHSS